MIYKTKQLASSYPDNERSLYKRGMLSQCPKDPEQ